jgi:hypothetical protein
LAATAVLLPVAILVCGLAATWYSVASFAAPVDYYFAGELGEPGVSALRQRNALEGNLFLRLQERPPEIAPALYARMRRIVTLSECKGIGIKNALALETLNITRLEDLARAEPPDLANKLRSLGRRVRLEEVTIWIRAANRRK